MNKTFNYEKAKSSGWSDEEIGQYLNEQQPTFNREKALQSGYTEDEINQFLGEQKPQKRNEPVTIAGAAKQYGAGAVGGVGGFLPDVANALSKFGQVGFEEGEIVPEKTQPVEQKFPMGTHEIGETLGGEPLNAVERILRTSGEWGGQGALFGGYGGPVAAAMGGVTGSIFGALYGGFKELTDNDLAAFGLTTVAALIHPTVANTIASKMKKGSSFDKAAKSSGVTAREIDVAAENLGKPPPGGGEPPPPPGGGPPSIPPESRITAPAQFLKSDFEIAEDIRGALSPLKIEIEHPTAANPRAVETVLEPVAPILNEISPHRIMDANRLGTTTRDIVNHAFEVEYAHEGSLWDAAKTGAAATKIERPELIKSLKNIIKEAPPPVQGGKAKSVSFATILNRRLGTVKKGKPISNRELIETIQEARKNYNYKYQGGVESHQINQFINAVEEELIRSASEPEREALLAARQATRQRATTFNNPQVLPYRQRHVNKPRQLYQQSLNPDTYQVLTPILQRSPNGQILARQLKRNLVERSLEPFLMNPRTINPLKFQREMGKLQGIVSPTESRAIEGAIAEHHQRSLQAPPLKPSQTPFLKMSEPQIAARLQTIDGLRELKRDLTRAGKKDMYDEIARTQGINLLFGGQMDIPTNAKRIEVMLNDRNGRFYLRETLGENNVAILDKLVEENKLTQRLTDISKHKELAMGLKYAEIAKDGWGFVGAILRGKPITAVYKAFQVTKKVTKLILSKEKSAAIQTAENIEIH